MASTVRCTQLILLKEINLSNISSFLLIFNLFTELLAYLISYGFLILFSPTSIICSSYILLQKKREKREFEYYDRIS